MPHIQKHLLCRFVLGVTNQWGGGLVNKSFLQPANDSTWVQNTGQVSFVTSQLLQTTRFLFLTRHGTSLVQSRTNFPCVMTALIKYMYLTHYGIGVCTMSGNGVVCVPDTSWHGGYVQSRADVLYVMNRLNWVRQWCCMCTWHIMAWGVCTK